MSATMTGIASLRRKLVGLTVEEEKATAREIKRAAVNIERGAKERSPIKTGRLRNSIAHEIRDEGLSARVGTNVHYAPHQEFGTVHMRAQPFLFPAFEEERPQFVHRLAQALEEANRKVARR